MIDHTTKASSVSGIEVFPDSPKIWVCNSAQSSIFVEMAELETSDDNPTASSVIALASPSWLWASGWIYMMVIKNC
jgi:hypothetical protein